MKRMRDSYVVLFLLVFAGLVLNVGCDSCCPEPPPSTSDVTPQDNPGPIIDVDPDPNNPGRLEWKTTDPQTGVQAVQDPDGGPIWPGCKLRKDFIGKVAREFNLCLSGQYPNCDASAGKKVTVQFTNPDTDVLITVTRDSNSGQVSWYYVKRLSAPPYFVNCPLTSGPITSGHLPDEFAGLDEAILNMSDPAQPQTLTDFRMQVELVVQPE